MVWFKPEKESRSVENRKAALQAASGSFDVISDLSSLSPIPIAPIITLIKSIVDAALTTVTNEEDCLNLAERCTELLSALVNETVGQSTEETRPTLQNDIEALERTLKDILEFVRKQQKRSFSRRFWTSSRDADRIRDLDARIDNSLMVFGLKAHIAVQRKLEHIRLLLQAKDSRTSLGRRHSRSSSRSNMDLPPPPSIFFGRDELRDQLVKVITTKESARVAILGTGGIGKTSLSLIALHSKPVEDLFGIRRFFVRCDAAPTPQGLLSAIAAKLDLTGEDLLSQIVECFEAEDGRSLVVLDNFETCWEPFASRSEVENILNRIASVPNVVLVITLRGSERPLGPNWTRPFFPALEPLDQISARLTFLSISDASENDPSVGKLLHHLGNLPLAIALMANLAQYEAPAALLERWNDERTGMLNRGMEDRLSSLEISIKISLESPRMQSDHEARELLFLAAHLPDGFSDTKHIQGVAPGLTHPLRAAATLKQVALAYSDESRCLAVLAPIRAYIMDHFPPQPSNLLTLRQYYVTLARTGEKIEAGEDSRAIVKLLTPEIGNLEAVISEALESDIERSEAEKMIKASIHLTDLFRYTGLGSPRCLVLSAAYAKKLKDEVLEANAIRYQGELLYARSERSSARNAFEYALELYTKQGFLSGQGRCTMMIGMLESQAGKYEASANHIQKALEIYEAAQDSLGQADCHLRIGQASAWKKEYDTANKHVRQALDAYTSYHHLRGCARCKWLIGFILYDSHTNYSEAQTYLESARKEYHALDDSTGEANAYRILGRLSLVQKDYTTAENHLLNAVEMYEKVKWRFGQADCLQGLGEIKESQGGTSEAEKFYKDAVELYRELNNQQGMTFCNTALERIASKR